MTSVQEEPDRLRHRGSKQNGVSHNTDPEELQRVIQALRSENKRLREVVTAKQHKEVSICGYLNKYRSYISWSFWSAPWDLRFFTLNGTALQYYKTERDTIFHPRGHVDVSGCYVELEGLKKKKYHTFSIVDPYGTLLMRMSSTSKDTAAKWIQAFKDAGCVQKHLLEEYRSKSPLRSADVRWQGDGPVLRTPSSGSPTVDLRQRWASDEDAMSSSNPPFRSDKVLLYRPGDTSESGMSEGGSRVQALRQRPDASAPVRGGKRSPMLASSPMYVGPRPSLLSSDNITNINTFGLVILLVLLTVITNVRLMIENLLKYGVRLNPAAWLGAIFAPKGNPLLLLCWPALALFCLSAVAIEMLGVRRLQAEKKAAVARKKKGYTPRDAKRVTLQMEKRTNAWLFALHFLNTNASLIVPCYVVHTTKADPLPGLALTMFSVIVWMKLVSYAHANFDLREARRRGETRSGEREDDRHAAAAAASPLQPVSEVSSDGGGAPGNDGTPAPAPIPEPPAKLPPLPPPGAQDKTPSEQLLRYPENVSLANLGYFLVAPTLVYQMTYPRSSRFRVRWLMRRFGELLLCMSGMVILVEQYIEPTISNSLGPMRHMDWVRMTERVLKLAIPTLYFWLILFYGLFHVWLNILAELTRFGDREFYKDWWNASTIGEYWRLWNMPVHKWMLRHVYYPAIGLGLNNLAAGTLVFFVSGVFHELLVGIPLHITPQQRWFQYWAFFGIMFQVPMMFITDLLKRRIRKDAVGNVIFWISFCIIGQPVSLMLYYHDWVHLQRGPAWLPPAN